MGMMRWKRAAARLKDKRILVFGAGVIGSLYAGKLTLSGHNVTLLARNKRLDELREKGLLLKSIPNGKTEKADVPLISELEADDRYDYVLVALQQVHVGEALPSLQRNNSLNFIFMVNTPNGYAEWTDALGRARVIPAFPGAGGRIENGAVHYTLTSRLVQPTTIGEIGGKKTDRIIEIANALKKAGFPVALSETMDTWQKSHVAMVSALAAGIYFDGGDNYSLAKNGKAVNRMAFALKENFHFLHSSGIGVTPFKLNLFRYIPSPLVQFVLPLIFNTEWAETVISNHALSGRKEMDSLTRDFIALAESKGYDLNELRQLSRGFSP
jgi:2-dehydropantoate 2-reductase